MKSVFVLLFQRLQSSKTTKFVKGITQFRMYLNFFVLHFDLSFSKLNLTVYSNKLPVKLFRVAGLLVFFCLYAARNSGTALMDAVDSIQAG